MALDKNKNPNFPTKGKDEVEIKRELKSYKEKNFNFGTGRVLGSMCTEPLDIAKEVYKEYIESNLGNPGLYPGTEEIEKKVHRGVSPLINAENSEKLSVGGGTEGNILALWRAREKTGKQKVLMPKSAHFSFRKACSLLDMEIEYLDLNDDYESDLNDLEKKIDSETAAVVGIAGTTEHGAIDPIYRMAEICEEVHFHVDAAFGGFVIPFLNELGYDVPEIDFNIDSLNTLVLDPHKMGMSPVPLGLFFSGDDGEVSIPSPYLTGKEQKTIRGTRASASIPAFWATLNLLGKEGYKEIISDCMENTEMLATRMRKIGFEPIKEPAMNIASFHADEPRALVEHCRKNDYHISRTVTPHGIRFVVMPHVTEKSIIEIVNLLSDYS